MPSKIISVKSLEDLVSITGCMLDKIEHRQYPGDPHAYITLRLSHVTWEHPVELEISILQGIVPETVIQNGSIGILVYPIFGLSTQDIYKDGKRPAPPPPPPPNITSAS
jgi:hypothetical protein